jgi:hypothetical protein
MLAPSPVNSSVVIDSKQSLTFKGIVKEVSLVFPVKKTEKEFKKQFPSPAADN